MLVYTSVSVKIGPRNRLSSHTSLFGHNYRKILAENQSREMSPRETFSFFNSQHNVTYPTKTMRLTLRQSILLIAVLCGQSTCFVSANSSSAGAVDEISDQNVAAEPYDEAVDHLPVVEPRGEVSGDDNPLKTRHLKMSHKSSHKHDIFYGGYYKGKGYYYKGKGYYYKGKGYYVQKKSKGKYYYGKPLAKGKGKGKGYYYKGKGMGYWKKTKGYKGKGKPIADEKPRNVLDAKKMRMEY